MYKLLIVDDEDDIREALTEFIDWKSWGYVVSKSVSDAETAIEYICQNPVDVVLTDVRMREKSGIDLAKFVYKNCPEIKVIVLSGYQEFEYAKESVNNNVYRYLLKPTDIEELKNAFAELRDELKLRTIANETNEPDGIIEEKIDKTTDVFKKNTTGSVSETVDIKKVFEIKKEVISSLFSSDIDANIELLSVCINMFSSSSFESGKILVNDMLIQIYEVLLGMGIDSLEFDFKKLLSADNRDELYCMSKTYIEDFWYIINKRKDFDTKTRLVEMAKNYIYGNYTKDISLNDVSDEIFVSATYLSRIFKKVTGQKFIDFLTDVRINKAKELLAGSDYKIAEICLMVGYKNTNYFVALFKQKTGMTPVEYRRLKWNM